ncbi:MAG: metallophosphoesterase family protein [Spirochaetota bacterium]
MTILQASDLHIRDFADADWIKQRLKFFIAQYQPDRVILTGDLTADGSREQWTLLQDALKEWPNVRYILGNHDMPLKEHAGELRGTTTWEDYGGLRLIYLDSAWHGPFVGSYTAIPETELKQLVKALDTGLRTLVFAHHPIAEGSPHFVLRNAAAIRALFSGKQVIGVFTGHFHGAYQAFEDNIFYGGVMPLSNHQRNHTWSQRKGIRLIEVANSCLRSSHLLLD